MCTLFIEHNHFENMENILPYWKIQITVLTFKKDCMNYLNDTFPKIKKPFYTDRHSNVIRL
jgi:hypothetical protein